MPLISAAIVAEVMYVTFDGTSFKIDMKDVVLAAKSATPNPIW